MRVCSSKDYTEMCRKTADMIAAQIILRPDSVLGLATGSTPLGVYRRLIELSGENVIDFTRVRTVNLDEYKGLSAQSPQGYRYYMQKNLFEHVDIRQENTYVPDGLAEDSAAECARYDSVIEDLGGIDLQLLGIGVNGHIGFNEPDDCFKNGTHLVTLTESTVKANSRFFSSMDEVPKFAYTIGVGAILKARRVVIIAEGAGKADALYKAFYGPITPELPASVLQLHGDVTVIADADALARFRA